MLEVRPKIFDTAASFAGVDPGKAQTQLPGYFYIAMAQKES